jgi:hypothetical protein
MNSRTRYHHWCDIGHVRVGTDTGHVCNDTGHVCTGHVCTDTGPQLYSYAGMNEHLRTNSNK